jgi:predicted aconitase with swiveling domain
MEHEIQGRALIAGNAEGEALVSSEPLSFWGGFDARTGEIIDQRHTLVGARVTGKIFAIPSGRGSSSGSGLLLEGIRLGTAPAAMILSHADQILALGAIVAREVYQKTMPVVVVSEDDFAQLQDARRVRVDENGGVWWE